MSANPFIRLDPRDNVVVARHQVSAGTPAPEEGVTAQQEVPSGHKIATRFIAAGEKILKYNTAIGYAAADIAPGTHLHSHNIRFDAVEKDYAFSRDYRPTQLLPPAERAQFLGYHRADGRVGTRNIVGVMALGNGGATVARKIANHFTADRIAEFSNIDGVVPYVHAMGDGMERSGEPLDLLRRTLGGVVKHANTGAMLLIAVGGEANDLEGFLRDQGLRLGPTLQALMLSETGGLRRSVEQGKELVRAMLPFANQTARAPASAEHISIGLQCGGSDSFSGLSANPALGVAVDILVRHGGTAILSETPEIYGAEQTLTARAVTPEVGQQLLDRIEWWLEHSKGRDTQINGVVSPGNNAGGLANILEKALGGVKKGGNAPMMAVYRYAEPVTARGLVFMDTPGYDPTSATGQIAGGANMIAFTTGRGSCFGSFPAPTVKLASNTPMHQRMIADMDINCGVVIDGEVSLEEMGKLIFEQILRHASGEKTKSELAGVGESEFVPWPIGVVW